MGDSQGEGKSRVYVAIYIETLIFCIICIGPDGYGSFRYITPMSSVLCYGHTTLLSFYFVLLRYVSQKQKRRVKSCRSSGQNFVSIIYWFSILF